MRLVKLQQNRVFTSGVLTWIGLLALGGTIGLYAGIIGGLDYRKLTVVCLVCPLIFGLAILRDGPTILFTLLVVGLSFSARFRPQGYDFHPGGAELALAPTDFALFALAVLCLPLMTSRTSVIQRSVKGLGWPFALFLVAHLLSLIPASDHGLALLELLRLLKMAVLVLVVALFLESREKVALAVNMLLLIVIAQGALATVQSVLGTSIGLSFLGEHAYWTISKAGVTIGRAGGTLGHANVLANFFEMLTPIALAIILWEARGPVRTLAYGALLSGIIGTFLAFSRAGWVSLLLGLSIVLFTYLRGGRAIRLTPGLLLVGLSVGLIGLLFAGLIVTRFTVFWEGSRLVRVMTAQTALNMLRSNPILGVGANNYLNVSSAYVDPHLTVGLAERAAAVVHNLVLLYGAELGVFGVVSFFLLLTRVVWLARRSTQQADPLLASVSIGLAAGITALVAHGMWDWLFRYDPVYTLFWFNVGLLVAIGNITVRGLVHRQGIRER